MSGLSGATRGRRENREEIKTNRGKGRCIMLVKRRKRTRKEASPDKREEKQEPRECVAEGPSLTPGLK